MPAQREGGRERDKERGREGGMEGEGGGGERESARRVTGTHLHRERIAVAYDV